MSKFDPFAPVDCSRGAPLGRPSDPGAAFRGVVRLYARRARMVDHDYDQGGAYWGASPHLGDVWAVWGRAKGRLVVAYVRADRKIVAIIKARSLNRC